MIATLKETMHGQIEDHCAICCGRLAACSVRRRGNAYPPDRHACTDSNQHRSTAHGDSRSPNSYAAANRNVYPRTAHRNTVAAPAHGNPRAADGDSGAADEYPITRAAHEHTAAAHRDT
jgi:hypothetical protein